MALQWADFPSGQKGLYGVDEDYMLNGVYAQASQVALEVDPDPTQTGTVIKVQGGTGYGALRYVLSSAQGTVGVAQRVWKAALPSVSTQHGTYASFRNASNEIIVRIVDSTTGQLRILDKDDVELGVTATPVLVTNAWNHVEVKIVRGSPGGESCEIRVNGSVKFTSSTLSFSYNGQNVAQVSIGASNAGPGDWRKDYIIWDGSGSDFNDFQGTVSVRDLTPSADVGLGGWLPNVGSTGWDLLEDTKPSNTLTLSGTIADADVVRISGTYYRFTVGSVDAGSPLGTSSNPWLVDVGATSADSLVNLYKAVGATGVAGTDYSTGLTAHTTVTPLGLTGTQLTVIPTDGTTTSMTFSETSSGLSWASSNSLAYGPTDASLISAATGVSAAEVSLTDLPADTTTVRGLIAVTRAFNSDGGDGNLQVSLSPNGTNYTLGANRPLTTAPTFYKDVSTVSPATSTAWTPTEVNSIRIKFNRTV